MVTDNPHHDTLTGVLYAAEGEWFVSQPEPLSAVRLIVPDDTCRRNLAILLQKHEPQTVHLRGTREYAHFIVEEVL